MSDKIDIDDPEVQLGWAAIDMQIEEWLRYLEEHVLHEYELDDEDRAQLIYCMRLSYIQGHKDGASGVVPAPGL